MRRAENESEAAASTASGPSQLIIEQALARIEERLNRLEHGQAQPGPARVDEANTASESTSQPRETEDFWLLQEHQHRYPGEAVITYGGTHLVDTGERYAWQYGLPSAAIVAQDFARAADPLQALAHPARLKLVQAILAGTSATAELAMLPEFGTTGQVYHHLNQLVAGGWITALKRGHWQVPGERVIPLLTLILIASP